MWTGPLPVLSLSFCACKRSDHPRPAGNLGMGVRALGPPGQMGIFEGPTGRRPPVLQTPSSTPSPTHAEMGSEASRSWGLAQGFIRQLHVAPEEMKRVGLRGRTDTPRAGAGAPLLPQPLHTWGLPPSAGQRQGPCGYLGLCPCPHQDQVLAFPACCPLIMGQEGGPWYSPRSILTRAVQWLWVSRFTSEACREGLPHWLPGEA